MDCADNEGGTWNGAYVVAH